MKSWITALNLLSIGFFIPICIIGGVLGGKWLDDKFNTNPLWLITGLFLGIAMAVYGTYNMLRPFINKANKNGNNKKDNKEN
ncbi:MAG: AtpZ/AtpI family protein [Dehalococcoidales bacterium]|nr:AtpZ/AtpI family protein [Dehalococcoidales bacterium]